MRSGKRSASSRYARVDAAVELLVLALEPVVLSADPVGDLGWIE